MTRTCDLCGYRIDHANAGHVKGCRGAVAAPVEPGGSPFERGWTERAYDLKSGPVVPAPWAPAPEPAAPLSGPVLDPPGSGR